MLAFLGMVVGLGAAVVGGAAALVSGRTRSAATLGRFAIAGAGLYAALLLAVALSSREAVVPLHHEKFFCDVDCDLAFSVAEVRTTKSLGQSTAKGIYYVVSVKARSDAVQARVRLGSAVARVITDGGRAFEVSREGQAALDRTQDAGIPLTRELDPGTSRVTELVFDLPTDARNPRLLIGGGGWVTRFLIGDENSPFHRKVVFLLAEKGAA
jgi:hypothetical protein